MDKLVVILLLLSFTFLLQTAQLEEETAYHTFFRAKYAANRAAVAAAQQLDEDALAEGLLRIDPVKARNLAEMYMRRNLGLDDMDTPKPGGFLQHRIEWLRFEVINDGPFPYVYVDSSLDYEVVLEQPGVVIVIGLHYPGIFLWYDELYWEIKAVGEWFGYSVAF